MHDERSALFDSQRISLVAAGLQSAFELHGRLAFKANSLSQTHERRHGVEQGPRWR